MLLELHGFEVLAKAKNGQEAVDIYLSASEKPDVIIMDHRMPLKNGIEASREIMEYDADAKIIFASADESIKGKAKEIGVISFKVKPFDNDKLIRNIQKALSNH